MKIKDANLFAEFERLCRLAPEAMTRLRKVTGKFGYSHIKPLDEKRWSDRCLEDYTILVDIATILQEGRLGQEMRDKWIKQFLKRVGSQSQFSGRHKTEPYMCKKLSPKQRKLYRNLKLKS
jgi:hypothetical protein